MDTNVLSFTVDSRSDHLAKQFCVTIACYDGGMYVASQVYRTTEFTDLFRHLKSFVKYWSLLYFDASELTPYTTDENGLTQPPLFPHDSNHST